MKNVMKFKFHDQEGFLSFVEKDHMYYVLVQKDTPKVKEVQRTQKMLISYELKAPVYHEVFAQVVFEKTLIEWVYHQLEIEKNLYFKELNDQLCVIQIAKESK